MADVSVFARLYQTVLQADVVVGLLGDADGLLQSQISLLTEMKSIPVRNHSLFKGDLCTRLLTSGRSGSGDSPGSEQRSEGSARNLHRRCSSRRFQTK